MPPLIDMRGQRIGNFLVLRAVPGRRCTEWMVRCICGKKKRLVRHRILVSKSCGCMTAGFIAARNRKHVHPAQTAVYWQYRRDALKRKLRWGLSRETFLKLTQLPCNYCGELPSRTKTMTGEVFSYNGIDRVDSSRGYVRRNVVSCCSICNRAKSDSPVEVFLAWATRIAAYQAKTQYQRKGSVA